MPRPLRQIVPDAIYHVLNRGNRRSRVFRKPQDYQAFCGVLAQGLARYRVELLAWCLMPNHWHLVLRPLRAHHLQEFMRWISVTHVRRHHRHYNQSSGHLYQGRYKHFCVQDDAYFLTLCRYVEANALRAGLVERAQDWRWSSLHQRLKRATVPPLSEWPVDRPGNWTALVNREIEEKELKQVRQCVVRDRPLGSPAWVKKMADRLGLNQTLRDRGRPARPIETLSPRQQQRRNKMKGGQNGK